MQVLKQRLKAAIRSRLSREVIVRRALQLGDAEGLEAVSLRRLASDFGVTPMALYRHLKDKQDLVNAMAEAVMEGFDLKAGLRPSMSWDDQVRRALANFKEQMEARPLALPLSIAYNGENPTGFWRMLEDLLSVLVSAGFSRRDGAVLIRVISNLLTGYLLLLRQGGDGDAPKLPGPRELDLMRRRMELTIMSLPHDEFPNLVGSAPELAEVWLQNPDRWWRDTVDLIVFGLETMLESRRKRSRARSSRAG